MEYLGESRHWFSGIKLVIVLRQRISLRDKRLNFYEAGMVCINFNFYIEIYLTIWKDVGGTRSNVHACSSSSLGNLKVLVTFFWELKMYSCHGWRVVVSSLQDIL